MVFVLVGDFMMMSCMGLKSGFYVYVCESGDGLGCVLIFDVMLRWFFCGVLGEYFVCQCVGWYCQVIDCGIQQLVLYVQCVDDDVVYYDCSWVVDYLDGFEGGQCVDEQCEGWYIVDYDCQYDCQV